MENEKVSTIDFVSTLTSIPVVSTDEFKGRVCDDRMVMCQSELSYLSQNRVGKGNRFNEMRFKT